jgi:uncharacterized cupin superfamily protein
VNDSKTCPHLFRKDEIESNEFDFSHPWNPDSRIVGTHLSELGGLRRTGVSIARIPPGKDSLVEHMHHREEEWIYILSGRAVATINGEKYEMNAGDFAAFPTPSVTHNLSNPYDEEAVYLMGGEHADSEIADFPDLDRRMVRVGDDIRIYRLSDGKPFFEED